MGKYVARCVANDLAGEDTALDFAFMNFVGVDTFCQNSATKPLFCNVHLLLFSLERIRVQPIVNKMYRLPSAHCTHFFGFRTALLGLYNGQGLRPEETEYLMRVTPNDEYIKVVIFQNKGLWLATLK